MAQVLPWTIRTRRSAPAILVVAPAVVEIGSVSDEASRLAVVRLGNPILRATAEAASEDLFGSARLHRLFGDMVKTMVEEDGVGLAAPQVAESVRLFVYWVPETADNPEIAPTMLVNPEIREIGQGMSEGWEGCLSIPGLRGLVPRFDRIKVKARNLDGSPVSFTADGFHARIIQHEFDHLDGTVFLDRLVSTRSLAFEDEWQRHMIAPQEDL